MEQLVSRLTIGQKLLVLCVLCLLLPLSLLLMLFVTSDILNLFIITGIDSVLLFAMIQTMQVITKSLRELRNGVAEILQGTLDRRIVVNTGDELHDLAVSLNELSTKHTALIRNLDADKAALAEQAERVEVTTKLLFGRDAQLREFNEELTKKTDMVVAERNKLAIVLSGIRDAVIAVDLSRTIILANKVACELTGYRQEELLGKAIDTVLTFLDGTDVLLPAVYCPIRTDGFEGIVYQNAGVKLIGAAKHHRDVSLIAGQVREGATVNLGCMLTMHDITQERQLEEMKLDFVAMAAHELRTPLTAIRGYAQLLQHEGAATLSDVHQEYLARLSASADTLGNLIDNLLDVSRIEQGTFKLDREKVDIANLSQGVVAAMQGQAKTKSQTLSLILPQEPLPMLLADRFRIGEVLANLVVNAIAYTLPGGDITVTIERKDTKIAVAVRDTGIGIPAEALPKLFNKFFRVSGALAQGSKGTGLGLFIAKSIMSLHKGDIWVESELGKGSTFTFTLSLPTEQEIAAWEQEQQERASESSRRGIIINAERHEQRFGKIVGMRQTGIS